jgi:hypothetical protein
MAKLLRLLTPFDGAVYISPHHVTAICKPKEDSAFPRTKVFLSGGIEFDVRGDIHEVAQQIEDAISKKAMNAPRPE